MTLSPRRSPFIFDDISLSFPFSFSPYSFDISENFHSILFYHAGVVYFLYWSDFEVEWDFPSSTIDQWVSYTPLTPPNTPLFGKHPQKFGNLQD